jgi:hypothetical protein
MLLVTALQPRDAVIVRAALILSVGTQMFVSDVL